MGRLSKRVKEIKESATLAVTEKAALLKAEGVDVVSLSAGEPDFSTPPHIIQAAVEAMNQGHTRYTAGAGILSLREAVADKYKRESSVSYDPGQILISTGAKQSLFNVLHAILDPDDECLIPTPAWVSYPEMVKTTGAKPVFVPTSESSGFRMTPDQLKKALTPRTKALILCTPSNPTGAVYSEKEVQSLAEVLAGTDVHVISDEVYEKMVYGAGRHVSISTVSDEMRKNVIVVNSCSKTYAMTGWRIGFMAGPKEVIKAAAKIQTQSTSNANTIAQHAAVAAISGDQSCVDKMVLEYGKRREYVLSRLAAIPGISCTEPEGAFYVFPNISELFGREYQGKKVSSSATLSRLLLESVHLSVVQGDPFGSLEHIRISYATSMDRLEAGLNRLDGFVQDLK
ncbi:MAG: pyridoxal phosphate-dependent aminotransferase [Planctomycetota bacterium]|nr:pyridoxal phosphate-dependent aminotransferase [Planctomycetota bacterium]